MLAGMQMEKRADSEVLDAAALRQQRRLKQAIRFLHRDSADLLPLDALKKLGTSKQGQPRNILQKRLLEAKLAREGLKTCGLTPNRGVRLDLDSPSREDEDNEEDEDLIHVSFKCFGQEVKVLVDTGCRLNLMSSLTVETLGLKELVEESKVETDASPFQGHLKVDGCIRELGLTVGQLRITSSFVVVGSTKPLMSLGSKTLKSLKCVIDTEKQMLVFGTSVREKVRFTKKNLTESSSDVGDPVTHLTSDTEQTNTNVCFF